MVVDERRSTGEHGVDLCYVAGFQSGVAAVEFGYGFFEDVAPYFLISALYTFVEQVYTFILCHPAKDPVILSVLR